METFFSFFRRKRQRKPRFNMDEATTPLEFREHENLRQVAREWLNLPATKQILSTLEAGRPSKDQVPYGLAQSQMAHLASFSNGFEYALNLIYSLPKPIKAEDIPEATFPEES
jgi:hypothetical protein